MLAIKQEGSVAKYQEPFEALFAPLAKLSDEVLQCAFLNGLDPIVLVEVLATEPTGLGQIMHRAQLIEDIAIAVQEADENAIDRTSRVSAVGSKATMKTLESTLTRTVTLASKAGTTTPIDTAPTAKKEATYKRLIVDEYRKQKEKGLCFKCEEKYTVDHRCKNE